MTLAHLLDAHPDALEADFQSEYGVALGGLWRGDLTIRRAAVLAAMLPPGSRVWVQMNHDDAWSTTDYLLAALLDRGRTDEKQKPVPRPADMRDKQAKLEAAWAKADRALARQQQL